MKLKNIIIITILLIITYETLFLSDEIINSIRFSFEIWESNVVPSIMPFFILSSLLINYGFVNMASNIFRPLMRLFGINSNVSFIFVMSMLSGFPSSSKYIKNLYDNNIIDESISTKALLFTHFSNPLFIIGTISSLLNSKKYAVLILIIHYLTNIIIGIIFRNYKYSYSNKSIKTNIKPDYIGNVLTKSIKESIDILLLILGSIVTFTFISTIINNMFNLSNITSSILSGILEMTQGLKYISILNISLRVKVTLMTMILSFGGLSIHLQVSSIIKDTGILYVPYLIARIIHMVISGILIYFIFPLI